ncbi:MAG: amidase family protein, partial [Planctomycetota bacterium]|nr:amidase family protein [Planctomycetota bacterium]
MDKPTENDILEIARQVGLEFPADELASTTALTAAFLEGFDALEDLPDEIPEVRWPREGYRRPGPEENPLNAWVHLARVSGAEGGPLAGRTVALKDNVALAGVPMGGGTDFLASYVPPCDATIVDRILDAGGTILGKAACEYLSASGGSHTSASGMVHNPHRRGHSAGGSSSGSAALVANGDVDLAIGGDQGGSIRIPSAFCGTVGMKPTFGLVPYTGILSIEATIDHSGPITANVADNALFLEVLAGADGIDPRQSGCQTSAYTEALDKNVAGMRIAVLEEGFLADGPAIAPVRRAASDLAELGAKVEPISIPEHVTHAVSLLPTFLTGATDGLFADGAASQSAGLGLPGLTDAFARWRETPGGLPGQARVWLLASLWSERRGARGYYAKAQNLRRRLR